MLCSCPRPRSYCRVRCPHRGSPNPGRPTHWSHCSIDHPCPPSSWELRRYMGPTPKGMPLLEGGKHNGHMAIGSLDLTASSTQATAMQDEDKRPPMKIIEDPYTKALLEESHNPYSLVSRLCDDVLMLIGSYASAPLRMCLFASGSSSGNSLQTAFWSAVPVFNTSCVCEERFGLSGLYDTVHLVPEAKDNRRLVRRHRQQATRRTNVIGSPNPKKKKRNSSTMSRRCH